MNIHEKMELALKLINEVHDEILNGDLPMAETNKQIRGLIRTFGKDHFIGGIELMKLWTDEMEV
jgi:hypothetical protein